MCMGVDEIRGECERGKKVKRILDMWWEIGAQEHS